jgi:hypothetical protein
VAHVRDFGGTRGRISERHVARLHAAFYLATGVWPLVHRRSFERVTGEKTDFWLAQTVGVTVMSVGAGLAHAAAAPGRPAPEVRTVACAAAAGLALVDVVFVARRRISAVYLLDAVAELALIGAWALARGEHSTDGR